MINNNNDSIDAETIENIGLRLISKPLHAEPPTLARVFEYPNLEKVYIMERDLYGNPMPKDFCFLAFNGHHGLIGKHMRVETLRRSTISDIEQMVQHNNEG